MAAKKGSILIVEDDADLAALIAAALGSAGFDSTICGFGQKAIIAASPEFDAILLDRFLPDMGGEEVLAAFEANPALREVPVIVMSVDGDRQWVTRLLDGGAVDYIVKPVRLDVLRARVSAAVRTKRRAERLREEEHRLERAKSELQSIYDSLQEGSMLIDTSYAISRLNRPMLELFGLPLFNGPVGGRRHPALGSKCYAALYGRDSVCEGCPVPDAVASGGAAVTERKAVISGVERIHRTAATPIGELVFVSVEDVTELREMQRRQTHDEKVRAVSSLAGASSHEINQPLGVISGRAQLMLMRAAENPELKDNVGRDIEEILDATKRIAEIVERLHNVTDFVTKPYVGDSEILDVKKSTRIISRRSAGGEDSGTR